MNPVAIHFSFCFNYLIFSVFATAANDDDEDDDDVLMMIMMMIKNNNNNNIDKDL